MYLLAARTAFLFVSVFVPGVAVADCWRLPNGQVVSTSAGSTAPVKGAQQIICPAQQLAQQQAAQKQQQLAQQQAAQKQQQLAQQQQAAQKQQQLAQQQAAQKQQQVAQQQAAQKQQQLAQQQAAQKQQVQLQTPRPTIAQGQTPTPKSNMTDQYVQGQRGYQQENIKIGGVCSAEPAVYKCTRKLGTSTATSTSQKRTGPNMSGNPLYHEYLCVRTSQGYVCGGQTSNSLYGSGVQDKVSVYNADLCQRVSANSCLAACITKAVATTSRPKYGVAGPGTNCQEWAEGTAKTCLASCN